MIEARGALTGKLDGQMRIGRVRINGDASITDLIAIGDLLSSDTVHLDAVRAQVSLEAGDDSWMIDRLDVTSAVASVRAQGSIPPKPKSKTWLEGTVDLAALAKQIPATLHLRDDLRVERGAARLRADFGLGADGKSQDWNMTGTVSDLAARQGEKRLTLPEPATLNAKLQRNQRAMTLEKLDVQSSFLTATGQGDLDRGIAVTATLDLAAFCDRFRDWIDLGKVELAGQGKIDARYQRQGADFQAGASAAFHNLRVRGLPLVEQIERKQLTLESKIGGPLTPAGWPRTWRELSLRAADGQTDLTLRARLDDPTAEVALSGHGASDFIFDGRKHRLEGDVTAKSTPGGWTAERLALALFRDSSRDAAARIPAIRWEGSGRYDLERDELVVQSKADPPRAEKSGETWVYGDQRLRVGGLKSPEAARIELAAKTDLSLLGRWLVPDDLPWSGRLDSLVQVRRDRQLWNLGARLEVRDPQRTAGDGSQVGLAGSTTLGVNGSYVPASDQLQVTELSVKAPYVQIEGSGSVSALTSRAEVNLTGSLNPDWKALSALLVGHPRSERPYRRSPQSVAAEDDRRPASHRYKSWKARSEPKSIRWMSLACD